MKKSKNVIIHTVKISNPDKLLFKNPNITKEELINYYKNSSKRMLPYVKNRILSTIRCPDGVYKERFFKKHYGPQKGLGKVKITNASNQNEDYYYLKNTTGIIFEAQMNAIEFHTWGSTFKNLDKPDIMVFDLDPDEKMNITTIRQGVEDLKQILDELKLISFLKTSGSKGYHIVIPFKPTANWKNFRQFAKNIALLMENKWPDKYTSNMRMEKRKNKIFIDWVRNTKGSSCVAPYSVRCKKQATVSMPISWDELYDITPNEITLEKALIRLNKKDPWEGFFQVKQKIIKYFSE